MTNPFSNRASSLSGPVRDTVPVVASDNSDLADVAISLYVEAGGAIVMTTVRGETRTVQVSNF